MSEIALILGTNDSQMHRYIELMPDYIILTFRIGRMMIR